MAILLQSLLTLVVARSPDGTSSLSLRSVTNTDGVDVRYRIVGVIRITSSNAKRV